MVLCMSPHALSNARLACLSACLAASSAACEYKAARRTKKAPQYALDAFVFDKWSREWDTLRFLARTASKRPCEQEARGEIVTFTHYNCSRRARLSRELGSGSELSDYFLPLDRLRETAYGKQRWWYEGF